MNYPFRRQRQSGSSLVEVLVSLVVLGTGIMGINALQVSSLKNNQSSYTRTQAVFHAMDLVERIRSNQAGAQAGDYNNPVAALDADCTDGDGCTAEAMAAHDVKEWQDSVAASLPSGSTTVCLDSDPSDGTVDAAACNGSGSVYAITIWWDDDRDGTVDQKYVMTFLP